MSNKLLLRQQYLALRKNFTSDYRQTANNLVATKILHHPQIQNSTKICIFISMPQEIDTHYLIDQLLLNHKQLWSPVVQSGRLILRQLAGLDQCIPGQMGILEPSPQQPTIDPKLIDTFIVPGLAFDTFGFRLGYGKGYYDRLLTTTKGFRLGMAYTDQLTYQLPHASHDVPMHHLISNSLSFPTSLFDKR